MSKAWDGLSLLEPLAGENPCGRSLDAAELLSFDAFRIFGQQSALDAPLEPHEEKLKSEWRRVPKTAESAEWLEVRDRSLEALTRSKDLRVLAYLGAALLRTDGPGALCQVVTIASAWLSTYWDTVHPMAADDTVERQSAVGSFNDHFAIVEPLCTTPLTNSRQHGRFSLRDIQAGAVAKAVQEAFDEIPLADLQCTSQRIRQAQVALRQIEAQIKELDAEPALSFGRLLPVLEQLHQVVQGHLARRPDSGVEAGASQSGAAVASASNGAAPSVSGAIRTREDAIRALDAVATFFKQTEPSSPVPLLLDRAKRLVSKTFMEVLADIAPGALGEARTVSGIKEQ